MENEVTKIKRRDSMNVLSTFNGWTVDVIAHILQGIKRKTQSEIKTLLENPREKEIDYVKI